MCTAIIEVPTSPGGVVRLLAVRDEDPARPWDAPGRWWPALPQVIGVRDRVAGGAWFAAHADSGRISLILNRADAAEHQIPAGPNPLASRGTLVLNDVAGNGVAENPQTANFNLVSIEGSSAIVTSWDGELLTREQLAPGMHMIAHHDVDDAERTPRIARWLPEFQQLAGLPSAEWREHWVNLLHSTAALDAEDDRAIIRDNRVHGYPTLSLLYCLTESVSSESEAGQPVTIDAAVFDEPGQWGRLATQTHTVSK